MYSRKFEKTMRRFPGGTQGGTTNRARWIAA